MRNAGKFGREEGSSVGRLCSLYLISDRWSSGRESGVGSVSCQAPSSPSVEVRLQLMMKTLLNNMCLKVEEITVPHSLKDNIGT